MPSRKKLISIFYFAIVIIAGLAFESEANAQTYYATGTLVSKNLLKDVSNVQSIDYFGYNVSSLPASTTLKVQFSQNRVEWYSADGTLNGWTTLSQGDHLDTSAAINLSSLGFSNSYFYYKIQFESSDTSTTPVLDEVRVYYTVGTPGAPSGTYYATGTLISKNLLKDVSNVQSIDYFGYNVSYLPASTTIKVQFSQNRVEWYNSQGVLNGWDTLSQGDHLSISGAIDLSALKFSNSYFYYKIQFETSAKTSPVLDEVRVYYTVGTPGAPSGTYYATGTLISKNLLKDVSNVQSIDYFGYNVSYLPASTTIKVQFSQNRVEWYNSQGVLNGWDTLSQGDHLSISGAIDLSALKFSNSYFYYKIQFETSAKTSPVLDEVRVYYTVGTPGAPSGTYYATGTLISKNLLKDVSNVQSIDYFGYNVSYLPASTTIKVQFSQNKVNWYSADGTLNGWTTLSQGDHLATSTAINLSSLGFSNSYFYYKIQFETSAKTSPVLDEVRVYYTFGTPALPSGNYYATGTIVSKNLLKSLGVSNVDTFFTSTTIPAGTYIKVQFSTDTVNWYSADGVLNDATPISAGQQLLIISDLGWTGPYFCYKLILGTYKNTTPIVDEIGLNYNVYHSPELKGGIKIKGGVRLK